MELTRKQTEGLAIAVDRYKKGESYTCIAGYAGSGKSTLVNFIIAALGVDPNEEVCYVAYTGKAAQVLRQKGCANAITAHKLLYYSKQLSNGKFIHTPVKNFEKNYKVIVVDEISMLPIEMWYLLLGHHVYILALGDPGQLPPVDKESENGVLDHPHVFLDEIMRQAQDSEIIRLSMHIREGKPLSSFNCANEQVKIVSPSEVIYSMYEWADQVLCATNITRNAINNMMRKTKGYGAEPTEEDKIISLSNHWEFLSSNGNWALTNGCIGSVGYHYAQNVYVPKYIHNGPIRILYANMEMGDDTFNMIPIDYKCLQTGEPALTPKERYMLSKNKNVNIEAPYEFAYAYAVTGHKAQGSEWSKILLIEEKFPFDKEEHRRWLYTGITRASEKLVVVRKE